MKVGSRTLQKRAKETFQFMKEKNKDNDNSLINMIAELFLSLEYRTYLFKGLLAGLRTPKRGDRLEQTFLGYFAGVFERTGLQNGKIADIRTLSQLSRCGDISKSAFKKIKKVAGWRINYAEISKYTNEQPIPAVVKIDNKNARGAIISPIEGLFFEHIEIIKAKCEAVSHKKQNTTQTIDNFEWHFPTNFPKKLLGKYRTGIPTWFLQFGLGMLLFYY